MTVVVIDLDTLALSDHRAILQAEGRWEEYHAALINDGIDLRLSVLLEGLRRTGAQINLITDRPEKWMMLTMEWLSRHEVRAEGIVFRGADDWRPAHEVKADMIGDDQGLTMLVTGSTPLIELVRTRAPGLMCLEVLR